VFDRELLQHMSGDDDMRRRIYESLDERDIGFVEESLRGFTLADFRRNDYVRRLNETVLALARKGPAIFLGRGADLILPRDVGFRVRFVALQAARVERYAREKDLSVVAAARDIERVEQQRERFIQTCFHIDPDAPDRFDLVINLTSLADDEAVKLIVELLRARGYLG
jgi:cytidylate kinase